MMHDATRFDDPCLIEFFFDDDLSALHQAFTALKNWFTFQCKTAIFDLKSGFMGPGQLGASLGAHIPYAMQTFPLPVLVCFGDESFTANKNILLLSDGIALAFTASRVLGHFHAVTSKRYGRRLA